MSPAASWSESWAVLLPIQSQFMLCLFWVVSSLACIASLLFPPNPVDDQPTSTGKPGLARSLVRSSTFAGASIHPVSHSVSLRPSIHPSHPILSLPLFSLSNPSLLACFLFYLLLSTFLLRIVTLCPLSLSFAIATTAQPCFGFDNHLSRVPEQQDSSLTLQSVYIST
ncbi:hypothetical protein F5B21DRAFT_190510 [Xylaria acuta]|nr:hypothetical protein F5B21DRAFT_190510 [Xylaria acuta]